MARRAVFSGQKPQMDPARVKHATPLHIPRDVSGMDLEFVENQAPEEQIAVFITDYQENSWRDFVAGLAPLIDQFLDRFKEIADAGPAEDQGIIRSMITHEQSFAHWISKELAREEGSLDLAISLLQYPMPTP